jgi:Mce-associated membrane protein
MSSTAQADLVDKAAPTDSGGSESPDSAEIQAKRRRGSRPASVLLAVLCLGAVAWLVVIAVVRADAKPAFQGDAAVAAGRAQTLNLMTLDYRTAKADLQRVVDGSTSTMHDEYAKALPATLATTASEKSVSKGTIRSVGLASVSANKAEVLVAGDATVSFPKSKTAAASTIQVRYRFRIDLQLVKGVWKSSQLNFAGLPSYSQVSS